ncbi:hypothetical protein WMY93_013167 [Mugilogobius chulae]|uniref:C2H2-type domain-containing protein n=1 Tax=Mugilogobius chulae TaxID=88201 RepID=A0AAW0P5M4_9GOBI
MEECGKCFHLSYLLKSHQNSHSGERPYICDLCGKGFSSPQTRSTHRRYVHAKPEERCVCGVCGKTYRSDSGLRTHMLRHTSKLTTAAETKPTADGMLLKKTPSHQLLSLNSSLASNVERLFLPS